MIAAKSVDGVPGPCSDSRTGALPGDGYQENRVETTRRITVKPLGITDRGARRWPSAYLAFGFGGCSVVMVPHAGTNLGTVRSTGLLGGGSG